jgi:hypothetical protein
MKDWIRNSVAAHSPKRHKSLDFAYLIYLYDPIIKNGCSMAGGKV